MPFDQFESPPSPYFFVHNSIIFFSSVCLNQALDKEVRLSGDLSELFIGDDSYSTGDLCTVFSVLSQVLVPFTLHLASLIAVLCWIILDNTRSLSKTRYPSFFFCLSLFY